MTEVFVASRLTMARSLRGLTAAELAKKADVTPEWLSKVERGRMTPSNELVNRLAKELDFPVEFLHRDSVPLPAAEAFHFRASSKLALKDETAARALASLACELSEWLDRTYELPIPGIPEIQEIADAEVEPSPDVAAEALRSFWGLGVAPISNMVALLEAKGARIFSVHGAFQSIDAFSFRHNGSAIIFLNPSKSAERLRFDLAHELGHLLLHGGSLYESRNKLRERQANDFASGFLMPRTGLLGSLRGNVTVERLPRLRDLWKVSAMAIVVRLHQLEVLTDWTYRLMCQELSKRGFRRAEPGSTLIPESSSLWTQVIADLRDQGLGYPYLASLIGVRAGDIRSLLVGLVPMAIKGSATKSSRGTGNLRLVELGYLSVTRIRARAFRGLGAAVALDTACFARRRGGKCMAELGIIRRYHYWSDPRIMSIAAENSIKLGPRWRVNIGTPSVGVVPQVGLTQEPRAPQLHDIATKIEEAIGRLAVEDFVTPPPARFAKGAGTVTFAPYTRWDTDAIAVAIHTKTVSSDGQRVELCLFGSIDNCLDALPSSPAKPPTWRASSTWAIEEFLKHRGSRKAQIYDDDEAIAVETLRVFNMEGMTGRHVGKRVASGEWFAEIYHDAVLDKKRWDFKPGMGIPDPVDRILIGAPLWVRSHG